MKKVLILTALLFTLPVMARDYAGALPYLDRRHEISFSGAVFPGRLNLDGYRYDSDVNGILDVSGVTGIYESSKYYSKQYTSGSWTFSYAYNFTRVIALKASLSYEGGRCTFYNVSDDSRVWSSSDNYITAMGHLRVSWLNRPFFRLYSSLGMGVSVESIRKADTGTRQPDVSDVRFAAQFCPAGISFGRRLFGIVELGIGHLYAGCCAGVGYRF